MLCLQGAGGGDAACLRARTVIFAYLFARISARSPSSVDAYMGQTRKVFHDNKSFSNFWLP